MEKDQIHQKQREWFEESFSQDYVKIYSHRDNTEAGLAIENLLAILDIPINSQCLDLCCGFGRHLSLLNKKGIRTYGIDLSFNLLQIAKEYPQTEGKIILSDMRHLPFLNRFDFVFSFFSSFGYFEDDQENLDVLREISTVLKPHGHFLIDYFNPEYVRKNLISEDMAEFPEFTLMQKRRIEQEKNAVMKSIVIKDQEGERTYRECVKLYGPGDFDKFCRLVGLQIINIWGDCRGSQFSEDSPRLIIYGQRCN